MREGVGVPEVGIYRSHQDPHLDRNQVDTGQRHAHPPVDDDAFVENAIKHVYDAGAFWFKGCHAGPMMKLKQC